MDTPCPGSCRLRRGAPRPSRLATAVLATAAVLAAGCTRTVEGTGRVALDARPSPTPSPTPTLPGSRCPQAATPTSATDLAPVIVAASPDRLPLLAGSSGPIDERAFLGNPAFQQFPDSQEFLRAVGFVAGYTRTWSRGQPGRPRSRTENISVYQFRDTAGACAYMAWNTTNFHLRPVPRDTAKGTAGSTFASGDTIRVASYMAPKGRFVVLTGLIENGPKAAPLGTVALDLLEVQYARL